jgi:hypothetical protein
MTLSRRGFLGAGLGLLGASIFPRRALAKSGFTLAQLSTAGRWDVRPTSFARLAQILEDRTTLDPPPDPVQVSLSSAELFRYPFLVLTGEGSIGALSEVELNRLRTFLSAGGFLWVDNAEARPGGDFDASVRAELRRALPGVSIGKLDPAHTLFKSFYIVDRPVGRVATTSYVEAIERDGRAAVIFTQNDVLGAFARDGSGSWEYDVVPGGEIQRDRAFRFGVNVVMYALCLSYKSDGVHIDYLLKRRDWRGDE